MTLAAFLVAVPLVAIPAIAGTEPGPDPRPTVLVVGVRNDAGDASVWRERRLGMGLRGRLTQMLADSQAFRLIDERGLAPTLREALGGYWLREREAAILGDLPRLHGETGADWIATAALAEVGVTRDTVRGLVGGRRWKHRARVRFCLHPRGGGELCDEGEGTSVTRVVGVVIDYRGDDVVFDQAGPAQAVDLAMADAFNRLMPRWASRPPTE